MPMVANFLKGDSNGSVSVYTNFTIGFSGFGLIQLRIILTIIKIFITSNKIVPAVLNIKYKDMLYKIS
jgi:hypothetical protein